MESLRSEQFPVHEHYFVHVDTALVDGLQATLVAIRYLFLVLLVENRGWLAKVPVDRPLLLSLLKGDQIALVVGENPWEDGVGAQVIETATAIFVQLEKQLLVLGLTFKPRVEKVTLFELLKSGDYLERGTVISTTHLQLVEEALLVGDIKEVE